MNQVKQLIATIQQLGIELNFINNHLLIEAPKNVLNADLQHKLSEHKQAIIDFLKSKRQDWLLTIETIASQYGLTCNDLQSFDADSIEVYRDHPEAIAILCQYIASMPGNMAIHKGQLSQIVKQQPLARCSDCQHFVKDNIGSSAGIGTCKLVKQPTYPEPPLYPYALRHCELIDLNKEITSNDI
jgi:hypothetical protein